MQGGGGRLDGRVRKRREGKGHLGWSEACDDIFLGKREWYRIDPVADPEISWLT